MTTARTRIRLDPEWVVEQRRVRALESAVAELDLDLRIINGLEEAGILYVRELVEATRPKLNEIPNFGGKSVDRIIRVLGEHGLTIRDETDS